MDNQELLKGTTMRDYRINTYLQPMEKRQVERMCDELQMSTSAAARSAIFHFRDGMRTLAASIWYNSADMGDSARHRVRQPDDQLCSEHITTNLDGWDSNVVCGLAEEFDLSVSSVIRIGLLMMVTSFWAWEEMLSRCTLPSPAPGTSPSPEQQTPESDQTSTASPSQPALARPERT